MPRFVFMLLLLSSSLATGCDAPREDGAAPVDGNSLVAKYTAVRLTADLEALEPHQREMIPLLIAAANEMNSIF